MDFLDKLGWASGVWAVLLAYFAIFLDRYSLLRPLFLCAAFACAVVATASFLFG